MRQIFHIWLVFLTTLALSLINVLFLQRVPDGWVVVIGSQGRIIVNMYPMMSEMFLIEWRSNQMDKSRHYISKNQNIPK